MTLIANITSTLLVLRGLFNCVRPGVLVILLVPLISECIPLLTSSVVTSTAIYQKASLSAFFLVSQIQLLMTAVRARKLYLPTYLLKTG